MITLTVDDGNGESDEDTVSITVEDNELPVWSVPADFTVSTDAGVSTAVVTYSATVSDNVGVIISDCSPASGDTFQLGDTVVNCSATDGAGNEGTASFTVTVEDNEYPTLVVPADITVDTDAGQPTAVVTFGTTSSDNVGVVLSSCVPASGYAFGVGITTVTRSVEDAAGNETTDSFTVTVVDNEDPTLVVPAPITVMADGAGGTSSTGTSDDSLAIAAFMAFVTASDNVTAVPTITDNAPGIFPIGTTTVTFTAADGAGNWTQASSTVTVLGPRGLKLDSIAELSVYAGEFKHLDKAIKEIEKSLDPKLWDGDVHLDSKHGHKVFSHEGHAVRELLNLIKHNGKDKHEVVGPVVLALAATVIDDLVLADRILAQTLLNDVTGLEAVDEKHQSHVDREIQKAQDELVKGDADSDAGKPDKAIKHYKKAWEHAGHAAKEAAKPAKAEKAKKPKKAKK